MIEFNNRIDAQRVILNLVNRPHWKEELYGLSYDAIGRWIRANEINPADDLARTVFESAGKLFFLANKSQEQVTDEYRLLSGEVHELTERIAKIVSTII
ncbi:MULTISPECIES: hypothetical protein [unclassified Pseudomonas]|uniref:hypothetical protein n=1 Tax=unclassified Pseudomonas TaxID=196821 RepID=UPI0011A73E27|nr:MULTISPECIES: hypothetical protein [unclassified Pseudomonas]TWC27796.1 hypothetical protein FBY05_101664 [Pseudomonas sp. SJZ083]TWC53864.1 hypothetical protein FBY01_10152 [Pseudomonas sp. SJZ077]